MVFTQREDFNIFHNNQFVMVLVEDSTIDKISHILFIALGKV